MADVNSEGLAHTADGIMSLGRKALAVTCDVSQPEPIREMFAELDREFGRIDFLGNIAGEGLLAKPEEITLEQVQQVFQNLVFGRFCMCQEAGRRMLAAGRGSIVNIGSLASITALGRGHIAYSMAMGAVVQMTRELSTEWAGRGVRVNAILPAQVVNPEPRKTHGSRSRRSRRNGSAAFPRGRLGQPDGHSGAGGAVGVRRVVLDHRGADSDGRRQPGGECGRNDAAKPAESTAQ